MAFDRLQVNPRCDRPQANLVERQPSFQKAKRPDEKNDADINKLASLDPGNDPQDRVTIPIGRSG